jgi:transposase-like protein
VRWYLQYKLSYRDFVAMMAERGISLAPSTILRWVQHYAPEFEKRWNRFARPVGGSWRVDETYIKVRGRWVYRSCQYLNNIVEQDHRNIIAPSADAGIQALRERREHHRGSRVDPSDS